MPNYLSPGVYVEEVSGGSKPIAGVGSSTGGFVGIAEKGTVNQAVLVTNWSQFVKEFGSFIPNGYLAYGVYSFFAEGGSSCYVVRVTPEGSTKASLVLKGDNNSKEALSIDSRSVGVWGNQVALKVEEASDNVDEDRQLIAPELFKLTVSYQDISEVYDRISLAEIESRINDLSTLINVTLIKDSGAQRLANGDFKLQGGSSGSGTNGEFNDADFIGDADRKNGIHAFDVIDDVNIIAVPDKAGDRDVALQALNYCGNRKDCFFIVDPPCGLKATDVKDFRNGTGKIYRGNALNSSYGALYYPWVYIGDPLSGSKKLVPPSGLAAGTYAYTDTARGVHKAPAGITEGYLDSALGVEQIITQGEHDLLNPIGVNVIRSLPSGICIWGARTLSADSEWLYVNIRRLLMYIEESIDEGTQWVVFEPNDPGLWGRVNRNLTAFLTRVWRDGALYGGTAEEAFFVKVDEENNPAEVRDAGQLIIEVGVAPVKPAEFVIIRVSQKTLTK
jgi:phage tail sheath protein FI